MILKEEDLVDKVVFVNGKRIAADIKSLDTEKGWVDIYIPVLNQSKTTSARDQQLDTDEDNIPKFEYTIKRLQGQVEVAYDPRSTHNRQAKKT
jgi:hypothetical protein